MSNHTTMPATGDRNEGAGERVKKTVDLSSLDPLSITTQAIIDAFRDYVTGQAFNHDPSGIVFAWRDFINGRLNRSEYQSLAGILGLGGILREKLTWLEKSDEERLKSVACARGRVLDFGGGAGDIALALSAAGFEVTYTDINPFCRQFADYLFKRWNLKKSDAIEGTYDTVFALNVLDHLDDPVAVLEWFYDLLNSGGICILSFCFDAQSNPLHVSDPKVIDLIEDMLRTHFEEFDTREKLDHHRLFRKRDAILLEPVASDGSLVLPPLGGIPTTGFSVALSDDIEIVRNQGAWVLRNKSSPQRYWQAMPQLVRLLLRIEHPTAFETLKVWVEDHFGCEGFEGGLHRTLEMLWSERIIKGWIG